MLHFWYSIPPSLPSAIDPTLAVNSIRSQRDLLFKLTPHCLPSLAESLYSQFIISQDVLDNVCNQSLAIGDRVRALLNCIEGRVDAVHSDFTKVVHILQSDPFLSHGAEMLVKSYCE